MAIHPAVTLASALATPTFLPPGKGGLILILGGLVVMGFTVGWLLLRGPNAVATVEGRRVLPRERMPRPPRRSRSAPLGAHPSSAPRPVAARRPAVLPVAAADSIVSVAGWGDAVLEDCSRLGMGQFVVLEQDRSTCTLAVLRRHARSRRRRLKECRKTRQAIFAAAQGAVREPCRVVEVSCRASTRGTCRYQVQRGAVVRR